uniref:Candidate secreted effector n=1 Tax=Meloidogyne incognita TaxID=6306 RepID=A0A914KLJ2_MELIC
MLKGINFVIFIYTTRFFKSTFIYLLLFSNYSFSLPPISPRFLHFTVQIQQEWLTDQNIRILAVFENLNNEKPKNWQMAIQLFGQNKNQKIPFITLLNITKGDKIENNLINSENMPPCLIDNKLEENIQIEVELSQFFLYLRAKNAEKYVLPEALLDSAELRVFFVRIFYGNNKNVSKEKEENVCQLKSELEYKETSRFSLPSTTPHSIQTTPTTTTTTTKQPPLPPLPADIFSNSILLNEPEEEELNLNYPTKGPYKRTRSKLPRRSTKAAQSYLSADHYVQKSKNSKQSRRMFPPPLQTPSWPLDGNNNNNQITSTTTPAYIDIIRDRQLYEEVQRSK